MTKPNTPPDGAPDEIVTDAQNQGHDQGLGQTGYAGPAPANDAEAGQNAGQEPDRLSLLEAEKTDLKDKLLRTLADMENLRRRTEREVADARAYAVTSFARDLLTVGDNLRRAIDAVPADARGNEAVKALVEGVELTERDFLKTMDRHGVKKLEPEGSKFDPNLHQAMFEVPDATVPSGTVMQVVQTGYAIGGRVLRPAMVGVAKGGPKAAPEKPAPDAAATGEPGQKTGS